MTNQFHSSFLVAMFLACPTLTSLAQVDEALHVSTIETEFIGVLSGDSSPAEKAIACKQLAIYGSAYAVPELSKLLSDQQLASWSRIALEAISGPDSARVLRGAAQELNGMLQIGAINSLGVLKDKEAISLLSIILQDDDYQVVSAAAVALGNIGGPEAAATLVANLNITPANVSSSIAEGCLLCADEMLESGKTDQAIEIYNRVRNSNSPKQRILEAIRGEILALGEQGVPLLVEQLNEADIDRFRLALGTAREIKSDSIDQVLSEELSHLSPERSALVILVLADRMLAENLSVILTYTKQGPFQVRAAAIESLAGIGNESCLPVLLEIVTANEEVLSRKAMDTIAKLPGKKVDAKIISLLVDADDELLPILLETVGRRQIHSVSNLREYVEHPNQQVRRATLFALGQTVDSYELPTLISQAVAPKYPEDIEIAQQALLRASVRMPDREACAKQLTDAFYSEPLIGTKVAILKILGEVGGEESLKTIAREAKNDDPVLVDIATQLLGKWMNADASPILLDLAKNLPAGKYQVRSLRAYLRIARQLQMSEVDRTQMCRQALSIATRVQEKELALDVLMIHPNENNLELAKEALKFPGLEDKAHEVVESILQSLDENENK